MYDWDIHYIEDVGNPFRIDAHTHGLNKFGSLELQFTLPYPANVVGSILNELGEVIKNGKIFKNEEVFSELESLTCDIKFFETEDEFGEKILRIIVPDGDFEWPEDSKELPYLLQYDTPYANYSYCYE